MSSPDAGCEEVSMGVSVISWTVLVLVPGTGDGGLGVPEGGVSEGGYNAEDPTIIL